MATMDESVVEQGWQPWGKRIGSRDGNHGGKGLVAGMATMGESVVEQGWQP